MASLAPISEAQLAANRDNAKHSTGPRGPEAKSRTRLNGLRHGLTGQTVLLPDEDRVGYDRHHAEFLAELNPNGVIETQLAHHLADDYWRLNRIKAIETNILALGIEAGAGSFHQDPEADAALAQAQTYLDRSHEINLLSIYEQRINRAIHDKHKELAELRRLREVGTRAAQVPPAPVPTEAFPRTENPRDGFGFSNEEIRTSSAPKNALEMHERVDTDYESACAA